MNHSNPLDVDGQLLEAQEAAKQLLQSLSDQRALAGTAGAPNDHYGQVVDLCNSILETSLACGRAENSPNVTRKILSWNDFETALEQEIDEGVADHADDPETGVLASATGFVSERILEVMVSSVLYDRLSRRGHEMLRSALETSDKAPAAPAALGRSPSAPEMTP